jgi:hypothetical protein
MNSAEFGFYGIRKDAGNSITGSTGTSTPNQSFSGTIIVNSPTTLRIKVFGGTCASASSVSTNGYLTITSPTYQGYTVPANGYATVNRDISLGIGTYSFYGSFSIVNGNNCGNNISISLLS